MLSLKNNLLWLLVGLFACTQPAVESVQTVTRQTAGGARYSLFYPGSLAVRAVTSRPVPESPPCLLSVAAAYTDLQTNHPLDLLVCNGQVLQRQVKVGYLNGVLTSLGDTLTITRLAAGELPSSTEIERARNQRGTLLLQELLVFQGQNQKSDGGSLFQRRALVEFANRRFAVVESHSDSVTMKQFGDDLVELGAKNALYLDMGGWDEGWYKAGGKTITLGHRRTHTTQQSNWLIFMRPSIPATQGQ